MGNELEVLTTKEAAAELRISTDTIRRGYRAQGDDALEVLHITPRLIRIVRRDLERWAKRRGIIE